MSKETIKVEIDCPLCDADGCDTCGEGTIEEDLPAKFEVCGTCSGKGSHVNPSIDGNGLSREDFDADPDFEESYFRGDYDVRCHECDGLRVVPIIDWDHLTPAQKIIAEAHEKRAAQNAQWDAEDRHTRRMESGGY